MWGVQKPSQTEYRLIRYHLQTEHEGASLLCNTVTGELVELSDADKEILASLPAPYTKQMQQLVEHHFLVPTDYDECTTVRQLRKILRMMDRKKPMSTCTILPTTACNARCFYCFEAGFRHTTMSRETADRVIAFIERHADRKNLYIHWFGGEPTLGAKIIDYISEALRRDGFTYYAHMTSNGYLFDADMADRARELWKLEQIQITLDGTEEVYNRVKAYPGVSGSPYRRVLDNIGLLLERGVAVSVRMNLDRHNEDDLAKLIGELEGRFGTDKNLSIYVVPLFEDCGFKPVAHTTEDKQHLAHRQLALYELIAGKAMLKKTRLPHLKLNCCMADTDSSAIITPDGKLAKCEHRLEESVGDLESDYTEPELIASWKETTEIPECSDCPLFPGCVRLKKCTSAGKCILEHRNNETEKLRFSMRLLHLSVNNE